MKKIDITTEDVEHVAVLSRININNEEKAKFALNLSEIIHYVEELENAPTENVQMIDQSNELLNIARNDKISPSLSNKDVLKNAPNKQESFIKTEKIFE